MIESQGLTVTLQEFYERVCRSTTARCDFHLIGQLHPLPAELEEELLRIAQEATQSVVRPADADEIRMIPEYAEKFLRLSIYDDSRGFNVEEGLRKADHWGFKNIRERAAQIHATCEITSSEGKGTRVQVNVPLHLKRLGLAIR